MNWSAWTSIGKPQRILQVTFGFILLFYALVLINQGFNYILTWDVFGYYLYLPATFIYGDPFFQDQTWIDAIIKSYDNTWSLYQLVDLEGGRREDKYSIGMALLNLPFFFLGHLHALLSDNATDGFSRPYNLWINIGYLFYGAVGLLALSDVLKRLFSPSIAAITLLSTFLGTNLFHQVFGAAGMPHVYAFCLYALLLRCLCRWEPKPERLLSLFTGIVLGLLVLVRPTEGMALLLVVLWIYQGESIRDFVQQKIIGWIPAVWLPFGLGFLGVVSLQLIRWKLATSQFLFMGYQNPGEGFDFLAPHTWDFLFSFRKGWLLYTPLMVFALLGIAVLKPSGKRRAILLYTLVCLFIVSSWSCWWYADSFGNRGIVQAYAVFAMPFAALVRWFDQQKTFLKVVGALLLIVLISFNLFQTWQFQEGMIHSSRMTQRAYSEVFLSTQVPSNIDDLFSLDREAAMRHPMDTVTFSERTSFPGPERDTINDANPYATLLKRPYVELSEQENIWVEVEATLCRENNKTGWPAMVFSIERAEGEYAGNYQWPDPELYDMGKDTIRFRGAYLTPHIRSTEDAVKVYFWLNEPGSVTILDPLISIRQKP